MTISPTSLIHIYILNLYINEIESEAILSMESHLADETNDTKDETTQDFLVSK